MEQAVHWKRIGHYFNSWRGNQCFPLITDPLTAVFTTSRYCRYWSRCRRNTLRFLTVALAPQKAMQSMGVVAMLCTMGWAQPPRKKQCRYGPVTMAARITLASDSVQVKQLRVQEGIMCWKMTYRSLVGNGRGFPAVG